MPTGAPLNHGESHMIVVSSVSSQHGAILPEYTDTFPVSSNFPIHCGHVDIRHQNLSRFGPCCPGSAGCAKVCFLQFPPTGAKISRKKINRSAHRFEFVFGDHASPELGTKQSRKADHEAGGRNGLFSGFWSPRKHRRSSVGIAADLDRLIPQAKAGLARFEPQNTCWHNRRLQIVQARRWFRQLVPRRQGT